MRKHAQSTEKLHQMGYQTLVVYKDVWGWRVRDESIQGRQYWNDLKRTPMQCVSAVRKGLVPVKLD